MFECAFLPGGQGVSKQKRTVTSTDGQLTVVGSGRVAKKLHQRRRPAAERTATEASRRDRPN